GDRVASRMSDVLARIRAQASRRRQRLALVEGEDERVVRAAARLAGEGLAEVHLVSEPAQARATADRAGVSLEHVVIHNPGDARAIEATDAALREAGASAVDAPRLARDPVYQAAARVRSGEAACYVAGAVRTTADVVRAAIRLIGLAPGVSAVSSFF